MYFDSHSNLKKTKAKTNFKKYKGLRCWLLLLRRTIYLHITVFCEHIFAPKLSNLPLLWCGHYRLEHGCCSPPPLLSVFLSVFLSLLCQVPSTQRIICFLIYASHTSFPSGHLGEGWEMMIRISGKMGYLSSFKQMRPNPGTPKRSGHILAFHSARFPPWVSP